MSLDKRGNKGRKRSMHKSEVCYSEACGSVFWKTLIKTYKYFNNKNMLSDALLDITYCITEEWLTR